MSGFEKDLWSVIKNVEFRGVRSEYQQKLADGRKKIKETPNLIIGSDKTGNFYEVDKPTYLKMMTEEVSKDFQKTRRDKVMEMDSKAACVANKLGIADRVMRTKKSEAFYSLKDHKDNFITNPSVRLINPSSQDIGSASRRVLKGMVRKIKQQLELNIWENTNDALKWFHERREEGNGWTFVQLDVVAMYPSIKKELLEAALG